MNKRCLLSFGYASGPPMLLVMYNSYYQIVQSPGYVMILVEMVHDARIIRIDDKHVPGSVRKWMGDSVGHWEGDTLVVETLPGILAGARGREGCGERMIQHNRWRFLWLAACGLLLSSASFASEIVTREFNSTVLGRAWRYEIYLPTGYETSRLRYPVLYLLHGNGGVGRDWVDKGKVQSVADGLIASGEIPAAVIVMPDAGVTWYVDRKEKMETAFIGDLLPEVEKSLRVLRTREGRLIGGLSMGGYGSLRFVMKYPERFAAAALLSPAIYVPMPPMNSGARKVGAFGEPEFDEQLWKSLNYPALWPGYLAKQLPVPMYINSGDDDEFMIEAEASRLYSLLRANRQPAELRIVDGAHNWAVWGSTLGDAMKYVFRFSAKPASTE